MRFHHGRLTGFLCSVAAASVFIPSVGFGQERSFFYKTVLTNATSGAEHFLNPTAMAMKPDGSQLFVAQLNGKIHAITLNGSYDAVSVQRIDTIFARDPECVYPYNPDTPNCHGRTVTGITFSAAGDLYVSHSDGLILNALVDTTSGIVSKLPAATNYTTYVDIVVGLPRSKRDHGPNGLTFGPDGHLYLAQAGMTNAGWTYPFGFWTEPESINSAAIIGINVLTGQYFRYATGLRNPYKVLFHSNEKAYTNDNGPNPSSGNKAGSCSTEGNPPTEFYEELNLLEYNRYYGHPNIHPNRAECTFNGGVNYTAPITDCPGPACYGANKGATGITEYNSPFYPEMQGEIITSLLVGGLNGGGSVVAVKLTNNGTQVASVRTLKDGLAHPIDVLARPDGSILIAEHNWNNGFPAPSAISVLKLKHTIGTHIDGDGKSDLGVFRANTSQWFFRFTSDASTWMPGYWAFPGDQPWAIDWDGDGRMDKSVFRTSNGQWHVRTAASAYQSGPPIETWAFAGDLPAPADYDGDGKTDLAVFRPSNGAWQIHWSKTNTNSILSFWGFQGWEPYPGFYDNDGYADLGLYNPSTGVFQVRKSTENYLTQQILSLGTSGDKAIPADYDGDGITDRAVWRPSNGGWYVQSSLSNTFSMIQSFGSSTDIPRPMDYDGDGKADLVVWRPSTGFWYIRKTSAGFNPLNDEAFKFGDPGDIPLARIP